MSTRRIGRPLKEPPRDATKRIAAIAGRGASKKALAAALGVSHVTLGRWLDEKPELLDAFERGRGRLETKIVSKLLAKALKGDTVCMLFALKTIFGFKEGADVETGNRVSITFNLPGAMSMDDFKTIAGPPAGELKAITDATANRDQRFSAQRTTRS